MTSRGDSEIHEDCENIIHPLLTQQQDSTAGIDMTQVETREATAEGQPNGSVRDDAQLVLEGPFVWTVENIQQLISRYGIRILSAVDEYGEPLFWVSITKGEYDCATELLKFAKEKRVPMTFRRGDDDLLSWAIRSESTERVRFILDKLVERHVPTWETCDLLRLHFSSLLRKFTDLMVDYLRKDKFTFEYARFRVPKSLFSSDNKRPVALMSHYQINDWENMDGHMAKEFWASNFEGPGKIMDNTEVQITAIAKSFCLNCLWQRSSIPKPEADLPLTVILASPRCPATIYESETLKTFTDWWFNSYISLYRILVWFDVLATAAFTGFALLYGHQDVFGISNYTISIILISVSATLPLIGVSKWRSTTRWFSWLLTVTLLPQVCVTDHQNTPIAFHTSLLCIVQWITVFHAFRPFKRTGLFISMVGDALKHSLPFLLLGLSLMLGYATAFVVLFDNQFVKEDGENFNFLPRALETLFYACIGNFDEEMLRSSSGFLSIWRSLLFSSFIYIGAIVLMSLLVAVLMDTYDRVCSKAAAERRKIQMRLISGLHAVMGAKIIAGELVFGRILKRSETWIRRVFHPSVTLRQYFHYLEPENNIEETPTGEEWRGRIVELERVIKTEGLKNEQSRAEQFSVLYEEIKELKSLYSESASHAQKTTHQLAELESKTRSMEETMSKMETCLEERMSRTMASIEQFHQKQNPAGSSAE